MKKSTKHPPHIGERGFTPSLCFGVVARCFQQFFANATLDGDDSNGRLTYAEQQKCYAKASAGFTLVELLVAVGVFSVAMLVGVGALLTMVGANHRAQAIQSVMNNLNYAVESAARTIPVGTNYHCGSSGIIATPRDCTTGDIYLALRSYDGKQIEYEFREGRLLRSIDGGSLIAITAPEVVIEDGKFYVRGTTVADGEQPQVLITIRGYAQVTTRSRADFDLQTTVTQRLLDK